MTDVPVRLGAGKTSESVLFLPAMLGGLGGVEASLLVLLLRSRVISLSSCLVRGRVSQLRD